MTIILADNLRMLRQKAGYTQEDMAEMLGVSRQAVAKWEMGESLPDLPNTVKLAGVFEVTLDELVLKNLNEGATGIKDKMMGMLEVSDSGQIRLPDEVLDLFDIHSGENVLLLADKERGIALMKCRQLDRKDGESVGSSLTSD